MQQNNTKILDEVINAQRPYHDRSRFGYKHTYTEKGLSSMNIEEETKQNTYIEFTRGFTKKEECKPSHKNVQEEDYRRWHRLEDLGFIINNHP